MSAPANPTRRFLRSALRRVLLAVVAMFAALVVVAPTAQAATFNSSLTRSYAWADCTLTVGVVPDPGRAAVGGATVSCSKRHSYVSATVTLKYNGAPVVGGSRSTNYQNAYGFGGNVLTTPRFCGAGYWQVVATFSIGEIGQTFVTNGTPQYYSAC